MNKFICFIWILTCSLLVSCANHNRIAKDSPVFPDGEQSVQAQQDKLYVLGEGDQLNIYVWRYDDLERSVTIDPSGYIYIPLAGEIMAAGFTIPELKQSISDRLSTFINNPQVDINVASIESRKIHVLGEVSSPGSMVLDKRMIAMEAIAETGGFTNDADKNKILLLRQGDNGNINVMQLKMDFTKASLNQLAGYNMILRNKDILFVPPSAIASIERLMTRLHNILSPIVSLEQSIALWPEVKSVLQGEDGDRDTVIIR